MPAHVEVVRELELGEPSQDLLDWAKEHINEDPDTKCQLIDELREMIYSRGECTPVRTDDAFLLRFLRSRKFGVESAYKLFINYHEFREENLNFHEGVGIDLLDKILEYDLIRVLPYKDQKGRNIIVYKWGKWVPSAITIDEFLAASKLIGELGALEARNQIVGAVVILDFNNFTVQQALYLTPSVARKILQIAATSMPIRLEALHVVHNSWAFEIIFNIFKPFLHEKMIERVFFHGSDMESLHKHVDPKHLPVTYRGSQPEYDCKEWLEGVKKNETVAKEISLLGYKTS
ncbi:clavesin-2 [Tribolium castaneum]|uniref:Alpha-tocopherol transfer protein-like n=1 Tax=Tribolium castaneum TaxID=7070 RepID=D6WK79_TRICA|nr:PREDICTED: clavesin-2 [Tribolium castaneum]EFA03951.1 Alpha-tocopherol transfer protein-like [Tribolium castaneum]|eukprot:XP_008193222.1 PREDICTED: clavesin-2 [Tribolium castaneum]